MNCQLMLAPEQRTRDKGSVDWPVLQRLLSRPQPQKIVTLDNSVLVHHCIFLSEIICVAAVKHAKGSITAKHLSIFSMHACGSGHKAQGTELQVSCQMSNESKWLQPLQILWCSALTRPSWAWCPYSFLLHREKPIRWTSGKVCLGEGFVGSGPLSATVVAAWG